MKKRDVEGPQPPLRGALACSRSEDNVPYRGVRASRKHSIAMKKRDVEGSQPPPHGALACSRSEDNIPYEGTCAVGKRSILNEKTGRRGRRPLQGNVRRLQKQKNPRAM